MSTSPLDGVTADDIAKYLAERTSRVYTLDEVAAMTGFSVRTLEDDCREGKVKHTRKGRTVGMTLRQIDMLVESCESGSGERPGMATEHDIETSLRASAARIRPARGRRAA